MDDRVAAIQRILDCSGNLFHKFNPTRDRAFLTVDLTMPQLKALICVSKNNGATSGEIASNLGVGLSTVTGIVDRLIEQGLATRREDPKDRRIARVLATEPGDRLVTELLRYRSELIGDILAHLDTEQLRVVEQAFGYLLQAVEDMARERERAPEEVRA
jgi:DNA-binding MarR family transcriptional regulator